MPLSRPMLHLTYDVDIRAALLLTIRSLATHDDLTIRHTLALPLAPASWRNSLTAGEPALQIPVVLSGFHYIAFDAIEHPCVFQLF